MDNQEKDSDVKPVVPGTLPGAKTFSTTTIVMIVCLILLLIFLGYYFSK